MEINGYDIDTVGEDMELVLRLQEKDYRQSKKQIVYDPTAVCYTRVSHSINRLLRQRYRRQRGLMDCLIKHHNMIANPHYGLTTKVTPVTAEEYSLSKAKRPINSSLDKSKLVEAEFQPLHTWQDAVKRYLKEAKL